MGQHVLVAGATGLVGRAAMEHFARQGVKTTAVSRRRPWDAYGAQWVSADLADEAATAEALAGLTDVTQVVFAALHEEPELVAGWLEARHVRRNGEMLRNLLDVVSTAPRPLCAERRHPAGTQGLWRARGTSDAGLARGRDRDER